MNNMAATALVSGILSVLLGCSVKDAPEESRVRLNHDTVANLTTEQMQAWNVIQNVSHCDKAVIFTSADWHSGLTVGLKRYNDLCETYHNSWPNQSLMFHHVDATNLRNVDELFSALPGFGGNHAHGNVIWTLAGRVVAADSIHEFDNVEDFKNRYDQIYRLE